MRGMGGGGGAYFSWIKVIWKLFSPGGYYTTTDYENITQQNVSLDFYQRLAYAYQNIP